MFASLKRVLIILIGFVLIALFVWFVCPLFGFAEYHPFQSVWVRVATIAAVVIIWLLLKLWKRMRAFQLSDKLMAAVARPRAAEAEAVSPETVKLRERFDQGLARLSAQRRAGRNVYELPWYVIIGAPGSGKTTALVNSGLNFALDEQGSRAALRGIGGTRNCDWWFTDEAIFLDTAGRYTTQDSDAAADAAGWKEFLSLLKKYRARRPINGIILAISAPDLLTREQGKREAHVDAARQRLDELNRGLRVQLPVYVLITKCDLIAGFSEYFEDLDAGQRSQVWGVTFPYEQSVSNQGPDQIAGEFDALVARLNERTLVRIEQVRDVRRRGRVFGFPQQLATIREPLVQYVYDVFAGGRFDRQMLLRGVYLTSGTQDGTPIDRLLGSLGRQFGATEAVMTPSGPGKSYFTADLLQQVIIAESGLAGVDRRLEARKAAAQLGAYAAMGLVAAGGVTAASLTYARNRQFLARTESQIAVVEGTPRVGATSPPEAVAGRLDALRVIVDSADGYRADTAWPLRWGLYQGRVISNAAMDAYHHELDSLVLPRLRTLIADRLVQHRSQPTQLFAYVKAYLMLGNTKYLDKDYLRGIADAEWKASSSPQTGARLMAHFSYLLDSDAGLRPLALNQQLVGQAQTALNRNQLGRALYESVKQRRTAAGSGSVKLVEGLGLESERVFRRRSGTPLSEALPAFYTPDVFKQVVAEGQDGLVKQLEADAWVWGESGTASPAVAKALFAQVIDLYERDYIQQWESLLGDLEFVPQTTVAGTSEALRILASGSSPLRNLLVFVSVNTFLVKPAPPAPTAPAATPSMLDQTKKRIEGFSNMLNPAAPESKTVSAEPGRLVTNRFEWVRTVLAGEPSQLDAVLRILSDTQQQLAAAGTGVTDVDVSKILSSQAFRGQLDALHEQARTLPPVLGALLLQIARVPAGVVIQGATEETRQAYLAQVVRPCQGLIEKKYPFAPATTIEVPIADFGEVFGYGGVFDAFFTNVLAEWVNTSGDVWRWRGGAVTLPDTMLAQFQEAQRIRGMFFNPGSKTPELTFMVTVTDIDRDTTRFVLSIDGTLTERKPGPAFDRRMTWPHADAGSTYVMFEANSYQYPAPFNGTWGWFRLVDKTRQGQPDGQRIRLHVVNAPHHADLVIAPTRATTSPLADLTWRQFSCTS